MDTNTDYSRYCYNLVCQAINVGAEKAIAQSSNDIIHNWSPNNVRRLIVGAEGFIVQYYTLMKNNSLVKVVAFKDANKLRNCLASPKYKPMVQALTGARICSSIEEIVYLTKPNKLGLSLPHTELDVHSLLSSGKQGYRNVTEGLKTRFVRLHGLVILNMDMQEFMGTYGKKLKSPYYQISDEEVRGSKTIVTEDWWNHTYLRPKNYSEDMQGGKLDNIFSSVKIKMESDKRAYDIKKMKANMLSREKQDLASTDETLKFMVNAHLGLNKQFSEEYLYTHLREIVDSEAFNKVRVKVSNTKLQWYELDEISSLCSKFLKSCSLSPASKENSEVDEREMYEITSKSFNSIGVLLYRCLVEVTLNTLCGALHKYPIFTQVELDGEPVTIRVPKDMLDVVREIEGLSSIKIENANIKISVSSCLSTLTMLCTAPSKLKGKNLYTSKYWLNKLGGAVHEGN